MSKLGLIAGGGGLPLAIAASCREEGRPVHVIRLRGMTDPGLGEFDGEDAGLAELGRCVKALRRASCEAVCFAGVVQRPDFAALTPDLAALKYLPAVISAAGKGDDALLRAILAVFEKEGFRVEGVGEAGRGLLLAEGPLGAAAPDAAGLAEIAVGLEAARQLGLTDVGQGVIVRGGQVLAREDHGGTDAMLTRFAAQAPPGRGGTLVKAAKPRQDRRVDLPTIGVQTLEKAATAGLAGVVGEAGATLVVDKAAVRTAADRLGLYVVGA